MKRGYMEHIQFIQVHTLISHEKVNRKRLRMVMEDLGRTKILRKPVVVDRSTHVILDGHHRCQAFIRMGIEEIPCLVVDYFDNDIDVTFRRIGMKQVLFKEMILRRALEGKLFPYKTTKHRLPFRLVINMHIEIAEHKHKKSISGTITRRPA